MFEAFKEVKNIEVFLDFENAHFEKPLNTSKTWDITIMLKLFWSTVELVMISLMPKQAKTLNMLNKWSDIKGFQQKLGILELSQIL